MFLAITALIVSVIQILIGVAIGLAVVKHRRRETPVEPRVSSVRPNLVRPENLPAEQPDTPAGENTDISLLVESVPPANGDLASSLQDVPQPKQQSTRQVDEVDVANKRLPFERETSARQKRQPEQRDTFPSRPAEAAQPPAVPAERDRRIAARRVFEYRQSVAPYHGGALPGRASFREVECQDISSTGFSFLSSQLPDFDSLVVALGVAPYLTYVQAQIVNRFQIDDGPAPLYRIGCRFAGQVH